MRNISLLYWHEINFKQTHFKAMCRGRFVLNLEIEIKISKCLSLSSSTKVLYTKYTRISLMQNLKYKRKASKAR